MRKTVPGVIAALLLVGYLTTANFTPPQAMMTTLPDEFQMVWMPVVYTDCETWEIRQSPAALKDLWPAHVDYVTVGDDPTQYQADDVVRLPREGDARFVFRFYRSGVQVYYGSLDVVDSQC